MTYHVHICTVGFYPEPSIAVINSGIPIDVLYLLNNKVNEESNEAERIILEKFSSAGTSTEAAEIDPYDYHQIFNEIMSIAEKERRRRKDAKFYINFTSGTNIMAGAVCSASHFIDCELYYVKDDRENPEPDKESRIIRIQPPNLFDTEKIKGLTRELLIEISEKGSVTNGSLVKKFNKTHNQLVYHTRQLAENGLIEKEIDGREVNWKITKKGKMSSKLIPIPITRKRNEIYNKQPFLEEGKD